MKELVYFVLGSLLSLILSSIGLDWIRRVRGGWSRKQAQKRVKELQSVSAEVERYHADPRAMNQMLLGRLFFITLLWIGQAALDYALALAANVQFSAASLGVSYSLSTAGQVTVTAANLVSLTVLVVVLRVGLKTYGLYRRVRDYDKFLEKTASEMAALEPKLKPADSRDAAQNVKPAAALEISES